MRRFIFPILLLIVTALFLGPLAIASGNYAVGIVPPFEGGAPQVFTATDASPTGKWALPSIAQANLLYVAMNGSDSNNCSIGSPCATYNHAAAVALAATPVPSGTSPWLVVLAPGTYSANIALVPWVNINGIDATSVTLSGNVSLSSAYATANAITAIANVVLGPMDLNFLTLGSGSNGSEVFLFNVFADNISIEGLGGDHGPLSSGLFMDTCSAVGITVSDATIFAQGCVLQTLTITNPTFGATGTLWGGTLADLILTGGSSSLIDVYFVNYGTTISDKVTLNGTESFYTAFIGGIPGNGFVFSGGATMAANVGIYGRLPVPNLDPTGSTAGYVITSTGPTTAPAWSLPTWVSLAAGGTLAPSPAQTRIVFDTTGAAGLVNLPASGTAVDGEEHLVKGLGATVTGSMTVNAGSGNTVESYASPGTLTGAAVIATTVHAGWVVNWKYQLSTHEWILQGIY